jgi:hypothetical protein
MELFLSKDQHFLGRENGKWITRRDVVIIFKEKKMKRRYVTELYL